MNRAAKQALRVPKRSEQAWPLALALGAGLLVSACGDGERSGVTSANAAEAATVSAPVYDWVYTSQQDPMRGTTAKGAFLTSSNGLQLGRNGSVRVELILRSSAQSGSAMFRISDWYFNCNVYAKDVIAVKFDNGQITNFRCANSDDGNSHITYVDKDVQFINNLKTSKSMIAELPLIDHGQVQFIFRTEGLEWE